MSHILPVSYHNLTSTDNFDDHNTSNMKSSLFIVAAALSISSSAAFTSVSSTNAARPTTTSLSMSKSNDSSKIFASSLAAASILAGVISADAAIATEGPSSTPSFVDSSSSLLAGRSGGRYVYIFCNSCAELCTCMHIF